MARRVHRAFKKAVTELQAHLSRWPVVGADTKQVHDVRAIRSRGSCCARMWLVERVGSKRGATHGSVDRRKKVQKPRSGTWENHTRPTAKGRLDRSKFFHQRPADRAMVIFSASHGIVGAVHHNTARFGGPVFKTRSSGSSSHRKIMLGRRMQRPIEQSVATPIDSKGNEAVDHMIYMYSRSTASGDGLHADASVRLRSVIKADLEHRVHADAKCARPTGGFSTAEQD